MVTAIVVLVSGMEPSVCVDLDLNIVDFIRGLDLEGDGLARRGLGESPQTTVWAENCGEWRFRHDHLRATEEVKEETREDKCFLEG